MHNETLDNYNCWQAFKEEEKELSVMKFPHETIQFKSIQFQTEHFNMYGSK